MQKLAGEKNSEFSKVILLGHLWNIKDLGHGKIIYTCNTGHKCLLAEKMLSFLDQLLHRLWILVGACSFVYF